LGEFSGFEACIGVFAPRLEWFCAIALSGLSQTKLILTWTRASEFASVILRTAEERTGWRAISLRSLFDRL
jgi:hypothetical protein